MLAIFIIAALLSATWAHAKPQPGDIQDAETNCFAQHPAITKGKRMKYVLTSCFVAIKGVHTMFSVYRLAGGIETR